VERVGEGVLVGVLVGADQDVTDEVLKKWNSVINGRD